MSEKRKEFIFEVMSRKRLAKESTFCGLLPVESPTCTLVEGHVAKFNFDAKDTPLGLKLGHDALTHGVVFVYLFLSSSFDHNLQSTLQSLSSQI